METLRIIAVAFFSLVMVSFNHAQSTVQESHQKLTEIHSSINKKHEELNSGAVKDVKKLADEIAALVESAKKQLTIIEKKQTPKQKEVVQNYIDAIRKNHTSAANHAKNIKAETSKPKPDQNKLKESSKLLNSQIKEAEKQNQEMLKKSPSK